MLPLHELSFSEVKSLLLYLYQNQNQNPYRKFSENRSKFSTSLTTDPAFSVFPFSRESVGKQWKRWAKPSRKWRSWWEWRSKTKSNKLRHWTTITPSPSWMNSTATAPCPPNRYSIVVVACLVSEKQKTNKLRKRRENFSEISWFCDVESGYARFWTWIYSSVVVFDIAILRHLILHSCGFRSSGVLIFWSDLLLLDQKL